MTQFHVWFVPCVQVMAVVSVFFILVSIVIFCLKTHPNLRLPVITNLTLTQYPANFSAQVRMKLFKTRGPIYKTSHDSLTIILR